MPMQETDNIVIENKPECQLRPPRIFTVSVGIMWFYETKVFAEV